MGEGRGEERKETEDLFVCEVMGGGGLWMCKMGVGMGVGGWVATFFFGKGRHAAWES